jgi:acetyl esterase/lipase
LYIHGGGFMFGSSISHAEMVARIASSAGIKALSLDYRLAPEHPFPAALEDCVAAYCALLEQGINSAHIAIAGDSAGGNLALATLMRLRENHISLPAAAALLSPAVDLTGSAASIGTNAAKDILVRRDLFPVFQKNYLAGVDVRSPLASPLLGDLSSLPPLFLQVGKEECLLDDVRALADKAQRAGLEVTLEEYENMIHFWQALPFIPEAIAATFSAGQFIRARIQYGSAHGQNGQAESLAPQE